MEDVLSWLNQPLLEDSFLRLWMAAAAGAARFRQKICPRAPRLLYSFISLCYYILESLCEIRS